MSDRKTGISKLAVLDWGLGGFSFVQRLQSHDVAIPILYFSDSGFPPYGTCTKQTLKERLDIIFKWCFTRGCSHIVVACNAASSVLAAKDEYFMEADQLQQRIISIIRPTVSVLNTQKLASLHVIGGNRTIASESYKKEGLMKHTTHAAQPLSACIERGVVRGAEINKILARVLNPHAEHLVLACTHYEVLLPAQIRVYMPHLSRVWYPSACVYAYISQYFTFKATQAAVECYTTGQPKEMHIRAMDIFKVHHIPAFEKVQLRC